MNNETKKIIYQISPNRGMRFLNSKDAWLEKDIVTIASIVFNIETAVKMKKKFHKVDIPISEETDTGADTDKIKILLNNLFKYVLFRDIRIEFDVQNMRSRRRGRLEKMNKCKNVCLFSGGVDSLSGILTTKKYFGEVQGVYSAHGDLTWSSNIVNSLSNEVSRVEDIPIHTLYAPKIYSRGYSQLRGFLYCLFGAVYVSLLESENLIISECGPTMYQPQFSAYDTVTMTTHPFVLTTAKEIIQSLLGRKIDMIIPYENMTKSEVIIASPYNHFFKNSHSCISARFGTNEGTCYGCIIRRLGFLVSGVKDSEYTNNPLKYKSTNSDNLLSLLRFSHDIICDYIDLPYFSKENVIEYNKKDLFKRFALDNFSALYIQKNCKGGLNPNIESLYESAFEKLDEERINKRISKVRNAVFKPNFNKKVI